MIVKVCGMREKENIRAVAALPIDWMGFIFYPPSPRHTDGTLLADPSLLPKGIRRVGVFVNATLEEVMERADECHLDLLQLHGDESPEYCHALQKRGYSLIKAIRVRTEKDCSRAKTYDKRVDYLLFETPCAGFGGSGKQFDWSLLERYEGETPFLLSGGIRPESAEALLAFHHPRFAGIDLNSGFETAPGKKDPERLADFLRRMGEGAPDNHQQTNNA